MTSPSQSDVAGFQEQIEFQLYGAVAATRAVLPAMREAGAGTLLFTTGGGSVNPYPMLGNINAAGAAQLGDQSPQRARGQRGPGRPRRDQHLDRRRQPRRR
ncbi:MULTISPECIES: hypothetical protein [Streptomyces]|uniref:hypothetical protein n=1 Tax=Streptomyces TaxID=1883 RepID=UPI0029A15B86|nr:hypothetical protein [Streptomyces europaeiscabiei]MDX3715735.1 hypothetical protein [Streptomyces europaeiscabiei]WSG20048.1 hypothetical protein OHB30_02670 [Streptomyces europaeiscabiei]